MKLVPSLSRSSMGVVPTRLALVVTAALGLTTAIACFADLPGGTASLEQVLRGRQLVIQSNCASCHSHGKNDPNDAAWLAGVLPNLTSGTFQIGALKTYAANLTPDMATGLGEDTDRQIFNALRFGLDPADTPDVVITASTPGQGNFPAEPHYLAPPMPWPSLRQMSDEDLWAIVAYLKHGIKPVSNKVLSSEAPADHWASSYTVDKIGPYPMAPYPAGSEQLNP
jgi:mono/diheme cytochrome c family protein